MFRSLWTGAQGMKAQQLNVDTISNNLANVNTTGYKKERTEFKSLLYQELYKSSVGAASDINRPVNLQVGTGVTPVAISRDFTTGSMQSTGINNDFALLGDGFFTIENGRDGDGNPTIAYTKDGSFKLTPMEDGELMLVTSQGYPVLTSEGERITFPADTVYNVDTYGTFYSVDDQGNNQELGYSFGIVQFMNPQGLNTIGDNLYTQSPASGVPLSEIDGETTTISTIRQGFLEMSNVDVAQEMVNLIVAQRAYELNSKSITTADSMLQQANELKR